MDLLLLILHLMWMFDFTILHTLLLLISKHSHLRIIVSVLLVASQISLMHIKIHIFDGAQMQMHSKIT